MFMGSRLCFVGDAVVTFGQWNHALGSRPVTVDRPGCTQQQYALAHYFHREPAATADSVLLLEQSLEHDYERRIAEMHVDTGAVTTGRFAPVPRAVAIACNVADGRDWVAVAEYTGNVHMFRYGAAGEPKFLIRAEPMPGNTIRHVCFERFGDNIFVNHTGKVTEYTPQGSLVGTHTFTIPDPGMLVCTDTGLVATYCNYKLWEPGNPEPLWPGNVQAMGPTPDGGFAVAGYTIVPGSSQFTMYIKRFEGRVLRRAWVSASVLAILGRA